MPTQKPPRKEMTDEELFAPENKFSGTNEELLALDKEFRGPDPKPAPGAAPTPSGNPDATQSSSASAAAPSAAGAEPERLIDLSDKPVSSKPLTRKENAELQEGLDALHAQDEKKAKELEESLPNAPTKPLPATLSPMDPKLAEPPNLPKTDPTQEEKAAKLKDRANRDLVRDQPSPPASFEKKDSSPPSPPKPADAQPKATKPTSKPEPKKDDDAKRLEESQKALEAERRRADAQKTQDAERRAEAAERRADEAAKREAQVRAEAERKIEEAEQARRAAEQKNAKREQPEPSKQDSAPAAAQESTPSIPPDSPYASLNAEVQGVAQRQDSGPSNDDADASFANVPRKNETAEDYGEEHDNELGPYVPPAAQADEQPDASSSQSLYPDLSKDFPDYGVQQPGQTPPSQPAPQADSQMVLRQPGVEPKPGQGPQQTAGGPPQPQQDPQADSQMVPRQPGAAQPGQGPQQAQGSQQGPQVATPGPQGGGAQQGSQAPQPSQNAPSPQKKGPQSGQGNQKPGEDNPLQALLDTLPGFLKKLLTAVIKLGSKITGDDPLQSQGKSMQQGQGGGQAPQGMADPQERGQGPSSQNRSQGPSPSQGMHPQLVDITKIVQGALAQADRAVADANRAVADSSKFANQAEQQPGQGMSQNADSKQSPGNAQRRVSLTVPPGSTVRVGGDENTFVVQVSSQSGPKPGGPNSQPAPGGAPKPDDPQNDPHP